MSNLHKAYLINLALPRLSFKKNHLLYEVCIAYRYVLRIVLQGQSPVSGTAIHKAKELGFTGLAIETKRPVASPLDLSKADRARIRSVAADEGIELVAIESMSNFCSNLMEERENNLAMMRYVLELAQISV
jgi:hypothetical protein